MAELGEEDPEDAELVYRPAENTELVYRPAEAGNRPEVEAAAEPPNVEPVGAGNINPVAASNLFDAGNISTQALNYMDLSVNLICSTSTNGLRSVALVN